MKILLINGGRGAKQIIPELTKHKKFKVTSLVNAYDDGQSTGEIRKFFNILGPSDIRKVHQLFLDKKNKNYSLLNLIFSFRFDKNINRNIALKQLQNKQFESKHLKINLYKLNKKYSKIFIDYIEIVYQKLLKIEYKRFNFGDCSLMNLIYVGAIYKFKLSISDAVDNINKLLPLNGKVIVNSNENKFLIARRENGQIIEDEEKIVNLRSNARISDLYLLNTKENIKKRFKNKSIKNTYPKITEQAKNHIKKSDIIIYCPGTQHSSLYPTYMTKLLNKNISENTKSLKIFITNIGEDYETPSFNASDYINYAFKYLTINTKKKFYYHNFFDYIFINLPNKIKKNYVPVDYFNLEKIKIKKIIKNFSKKNNLGQHDGKKIVNQIINLIQ